MGADKANWFRAGQIVINAPGSQALARPATVLQQLSNDRVELVTRNGRATVPFDAIQLQAESIDDALASVAQQRDRSLESLRDDVRHAVMSCAKDNGFADDMRGTLESIGIKPKQNRIKALVQVTVEVFIDMDEDSRFPKYMNLDSDNNRNWWNNTIKFEDESSGSISLKEDSDFVPGSAVVNVVEAAVQEVSDISYVIGED